MSRAPNALPQSKVDYIQALCMNEPYLSVQIALFMYHAEVPLADAKGYMRTYLSKQRDPYNQ